jgi:hypothetical protein
MQMMRMDADVRTDWDQRADLYLCCVIRGHGYNRRHFPVRTVWTEEFVVHNRAYLQRSIKELPGGQDVR